MCSSTLGPAIWPSLVTCPTSSRAKPRALARRISSWALARTWETVPGAESRLSTYMVWIESMITAAGGRAVSRLATMSRTEVAAASTTGAPARPRRRARRRSCSTDSSPET